MFTSLAIIITQGFLPLQSNQFTIFVFSSLCAVSFAFLFFCIVLSMELISKASTFMNNKSKDQRRSIIAAINKTHRMMKLLKIIKIYIEDDNKGGHGEIKKSFYEYENVVEEVLKKRKDINDYLSITNDELAEVNDKNRSLLEKYSFIQYWLKYCSKWGQMAFLLFWLGLYTLIASISIYLWTVFMLNYILLEAALCSVIMLSLLIIIGFTITIFIKKYKTFDESVYIV
jgi:hypothetical protein